MPHLTRSRTWIAAAILLATAAAAVALTTRAHDDPPAAAPPPRAVAGEPAPAAPSLDRLVDAGRVPAGTAIRYDVALDADAEVRLAAVIGAADQVAAGAGDAIARRLGVHGRLEELYLGSSGDRTLSLLRGDGARVAEGGADDDRGAAALARGVVLERAADGHVERIRLPVAATPVERGVFEHLVEGCR